MSYVRFGESLTNRDEYAPLGEGSQVYVFGATGGRIECCGCGIDFDGDLDFEGGPMPFTVADETELLAHLRDHLAAGHRVPAWLIADLTESTS